MKKDRQAKIIANSAIANNIYKMVLAFDDFEDIKGGQFIHIKLTDNSFVLRRPFCICDYDASQKTITIAYAVVGEGTKLMTELKVGSFVMAMFALGNGFEPLRQYKKIMMIGGGMGSAVLPALPRRDRSREYYSYLGFSEKNKVILEEELKQLCNQVVVATDDGSYGLKGFVTDIAANDIDKIKPDCIFCCGPEVMYKALRKVMSGKDIPIYVSLEQRMGCGIGACLVCNCKVKRNDSTEYLRVCKDGPVFLLNEVEL